MQTLPSEILWRLNLKRKLKATLKSWKYCKQSSKYDTIGLWFNFLTAESNIRAGRQSGNHLICSSHSAIERAEVPGIEELTQEFLIRVALSDLFSHILIWLDASHSRYFLFQVHRKRKVMCPFYGQIFLWWNGRTLVPSYLPTCPLGKHFRRGY